LNGLLPPFHHLVFVGIAVVDIIVKGLSPTPLLGRGNCYEAVFKLKIYFLFLVYNLHPVLLLFSLRQLAEG
jgi:hypothetical protein